MHKGLIIGQCNLLVHKWARMEQGEEASYPSTDYLSLTFIIRPGSVQILFKPMG